MNVYLNEITGIADGISTLFFSKKSWTRELELDIRNTCFAVLDRCGRLLPRSDVSNEMMDKYERWMAMMTKWGGISYYNASVYRLFIYGGGVASSGAG